MLFGVFILFLGLRFYIYIVIKYKPEWVSHDSIITEIPFYVSEIVITVILSYILFSVSYLDADETSSSLQYDEDLDTS